MSTSYFCLTDHNTAPANSVCDVCDSYVSELTCCPLEEPCSSNQFVCSSACIYYNDCSNAI